MSEDAELQMLQTHITREWPQNREELDPVKVVLVNKALFGNDELCGSEG